MNPPELNGGEIKKNTTKTITANNTPDKRITSETRLNKHTPSDHPPPENSVSTWVQNAQICTKYCSRLGSLQRSPDPLAGLRGRERRGTARKGEGRKRGERKGREVEWMERRTLSSSFQIFWLRPCVGPSERCHHWLADRTLMETAMSRCYRTEQRQTSISSRTNRRLSLRRRLLLLQ